MKKISCLILAFLLLVAPVRAQAAEITGAAQVTTVAGPLNVRSGPSTANKVVATLSKGSFVTVLGKSGSWYHVQYGKTATGYCHGSYLTDMGAPATVIATALNVRSGPGTSYGIQGYLHSGDKVAVLSTANGWSRIVYHGSRVGYVSAKYLSGTGAQLSVPAFLQTDRRWANVTLGTSGKTMAKIGCATTAIAMMESYRTGTTVYPDAMSKKLSYTSTGSVYWPGHYTVVTTYDLGKIKSLLDSGKPVLFGARNSYGTQHWVVITGYTGAGTAATQFAINDPGTTARTNLGQFLSAYPTFYKYFHY